MHSKKRVPFFFLQGLHCGWAPSPITRVLALWRGSSRTLRITVRRGGRGEQSLFLAACPTFKTRMFAKTGINISENRLRRQMVLSTGYHITSGILGTRSVYEALAVNGKETPFLPRFIPKLIVLSRQARDKLKETSTQKNSGISSGRMDIALAMLNKVKKSPSFRSRLRG